VKYRYSSFFNLGARWGGWSTRHPGRFTPGKETRYPLYRRLGGPQGRSGRVRKISPPPVFDPRTVQPAASRYTRLSYPGPHHRQISWPKAEFLRKLLESTCPHTSTLRANPIPVNHVSCIGTWSHHTEHCCISPLSNVLAHMRKKSVTVIPWLLVVSQKSQHKWLLISLRLIQVQSKLSEHGFLHFLMVTIYRYL
jgi:hypothetical protein